MMVTWHYWFPEYLENRTDAREIEVHDRMPPEGVANVVAEKDWHEEAWENGREDASMKIMLVSPDGEPTMWNVTVRHSVSFSATESK